MRDPGPEPGTEVGLGPYPKAPLGVPREGKKGPRSCFTKKVPRQPPRRRGGKAKVAEQRKKTGKGREGKKKLKDFRVKAAMVESEYNQKTKLV